METTTITASVLRERMRLRGIRVGDLARESGLYTTDLSAILRGNERMGPSRAARLAQGILRLGLDRDEPIERKLPSDHVVITIRQLKRNEEASDQ